MNIYNWLFVLFLFFIFHNVNSFPEEDLLIRIPRMSTNVSTLTLPSNATSIRADITDNFSCENRTYGYYADIDNECQIFHVCLPVTFADGRNKTFKWSFICPESLVFSQEYMVCVREETMTMKCEDSMDLYVLNENFGGKEEEEGMDGDMMDVNMNENEEQQQNML